MIYTANHITLYKTTHSIQKQQSHQPTKPLPLGYLYTTNVIPVKTEIPLSPPRGEGRGEEERAQGRG